MTINAGSRVTVLLSFITLVACCKSYLPSGIAPEPAAVTRNLPRLPGGAVWNLETVGGSGIVVGQPIELRAQEKFGIAGWAVDNQANAPAGGVEVSIDDALFAANYGVARPDVAAALHVPADTNVGYSIELLGQQFTPGTHQMFVRVLTHDRRAYWEAGPYAMNIR